MLSADAWYLFLLVYSFSSAKTQLGVWLIKDLHRVSDNVAELTYTAFAYLSVFPLIDSIVSTSNFVAVLNICYPTCIVKSYKLMQAHSLKKYLWLNP